MLHYRPARNGRKTDGEHRYDHEIWPLIHRWKALGIPSPFQEHGGAHPPHGGGDKRLPDVGLSMDKPWIIPDNRETWENAALGAKNHQWWPPTGG